MSKNDCVPQPHEDTPQLYIHSGTDKQQIQVIIMVYIFVSI